MRSYVATLQEPKEGGDVVWDMAGIGRGYFRTDHLLLFRIQDHENGNILFIGRVMNPNPNG